MRRIGIIVKLLLVICLVAGMSAVAEGTDASTLDSFLDDAFSGTGEGEMPISTDESKDDSTAEQEPVAAEDGTAAPAQTEAEETVGPVAALNDLSEYVEVDPNNSEMALLDLEKLKAYFGVKEALKVYYKASEAMDYMQVVEATEDGRVRIPKASYIYVATEDGTVVTEDGTVLWAGEFTPKGQDSMPRAILDFQVETINDALPNANAPDYLLYIIKENFNPYDEDGRTLQVMTPGGQVEGHDGLYAVSLNGEDRPVWVEMTNGKEKEYLWAGTLRKGEAGPQLVVLYDANKGEPLKPDKDKVRTEIDAAVQAAANAEMQAAANAAATPAPTEASEEIVSFISTPVTEELEPTVKPEEKIVARLPESVNRVYDGEEHSVAGEIVRGIEPNADGVQLSYAVLESMPEAPEDQQPKDADWQENPSIPAKAGTWNVFVKAEKKDCIVEYYGDGEEGQPLPADQGYVRVPLTVAPAEVKIKLTAHQVGEPPVYDGEEHALQAEYELSLESEADAKLFDVESIQANEEWASLNKSDEVKVRDVNQEGYEIPRSEERTKELEEFIQRYSDNLKITVDWDESAKLMIAKRPITFASTTQVVVYDPDGDGLAAKLDEDSMDSAKNELGKEDHIYNDNITATGELKEVGTCPAKIEIKSTMMDDSFDKRQGNYDVKHNEGVLVVLPQSINGEDPKWDGKEFDELKEEIEEKPEEWKGKTPEELRAHAFSRGMGVSLESESVVYDGTPQQEPKVLFKNASGKTMGLIEGTDYTIEIVEYDGEPFAEQELVDAGQYTVRITGEGNYAGQVNLIFTIEQAPREDTDLENIREAYTYGEPIEPKVNDEEGVEYFYRSKGSEEEGSPLYDDALLDAGEYEVKAVWAATKNYQAAESDWKPLEIEKATATVTIRDGEIEKIVPEEARLDASMVEVSNPPKLKTEYEKNFNVDFVKHDSKVLTIDSAWDYDGKPVDEGEHKPSATPEGKDEPKYQYCDEAGEEIDPPKDAGSYKVVATWSDGESETKAFTINPLPLKLTVNVNHKVYGDEEPELILTAENLCEGDTLEALGITAEREKGEDAGSYEIHISAPKEIKNYEVGEALDVQFEIMPRELAPEDAKMTSAGVEVRGAGGELLQEGADYSAELDEETHGCVIAGKGNYTGTVLVDELTLLQKLLSGDGLLWLCIAVALSLGAVVSLIVALRLTKRVLKERDKILDQESRQSRRTIRQNDWNDG